MPYVYLLRCADQSYYTGWTTDLENRVAVHNQGMGSKYTRSRLPVSLVFAEETADKSTALKREYQIRKLKRSEKVTLEETFRTMQQDNNGQKDD